MSGRKPRNDLSYRKKGLSKKEKRKLQREEATLNRIEASRGHEEKDLAIQESLAAPKKVQSSHSKPSPITNLPTSHEEQRKYLRTLRGLSAT